MDQASIHNSWIDISVPVYVGMPSWPGDPVPNFDRVMDQKRGDVCTVTQTQPTHTGTHMDAPLHFVRDAPSIDSMPIDATTGPARVIRIRNEKAIHREELLQYTIQRGERILFRTGNSDHDWSKLPFNEDFIFIARDGAEYLAECEIYAQSRSITSRWAAFDRIPWKRT